MKLEFKTGLKSEQFDEFVVNFEGSSFMQVSSWAKIKNNWQSDLAGVFKNDILVATAVILKRKLFLKKTLIYIPRGLTIDYNDKELVSFFINHLKKYAKENNAIAIKMDPFSAFNEYPFKSINNENKEDIKSPLTKQSNIIHEVLINNGFKHGGFKKEVNAYIQPRYTMVIPLTDNNGNHYTGEYIKQNFPKNVRNYIGKYHEVRGVTFEYSNNLADVKKLFSLLSCTEKRQHINLRDEHYFESIMKNYKDNAVLFFSKIDFDKYIEFVNNDMTLNPNKIDFSKEKINEATTLKAKYGNEAIIGATIVMMPTCKNGNRVASFLYAGTNTEILPCLKATNGLMYYRICYAIEHGCDYCDMGGVDGSLSDHLSLFKSKFNPNVVELIGEYDLVVNKLLYSTFKKLLLIKKKIQHIK